MRPYNSLSRIYLICLTLFSVGVFSETALSQDYWHRALSSKASLLQAQRVSTLSQLQQQEYLLQQYNALQLSGLASPAEVYEVNAAIRVLQVQLQWLNSQQHQIDNLSQVVVNQLEAPPVPPGPKSGYISILVPGFNDLPETNPFAVLSIPLSRKLEKLVKGITLSTEYRQAAHHAEVAYCEEYLQRLSQIDDDSPSITSELAMIKLRKQSAATDALLVHETHLVEVSPELRELSLGGQLIRSPADFQAFLSSAASWNLVSLEEQTPILSAINAMQQAQAETAQQLELSKTELAAKESKIVELRQLVYHDAFFIEELTREAHLLAILKAQVLVLTQQLEARQAASQYLVRLNKHSQTAASNKTLKPLRSAFMALFELRVNQTGTLQLATAHKEYLGWRLAALRNLEKEHCATWKEVATTELLLQQAELAEKETVALHEAAQAVLTSVKQTIRHVKWTPESPVVDLQTTPETNMILSRKTLP